MNEPRFGYQGPERADANLCWSCAESVPRYAIECPYCGASLIGRGHDATTTDRTGSMGRRKRGNGHGGGRQHDREPTWRDPFLKADRSTGRASGFESQNAPHWNDADFERISRAAGWPNRDRGDVRSLGHDRDDARSPSGDREDVGSPDRDQEDAWSANRDQDDDGIAPAQAGSPGWGGDFPIEPTRHFASSRARRGSRAGRRFAVLALLAAVVGVGWVARSWENSSVSPQPDPSREVAEPAQGTGAPDAVGDARVQRSPVTTMAESGGETVPGAGTERPAEEADTAPPLDDLPASMADSGGEKIPDAGTERPAEEVGAALPLDALPANMAESGGEKVPDAGTERPAEEIDTASPLDDLPERWIPEPPPVGPVTTSAASPAAGDPGSNNEPSPTDTWDARDVQRGLARLGYYRGSIDGKAGPQTSRAVRRFQRDQGLEPTGRIGPPVVAALEKGNDQPVPIGNPDVRDAQREGSPDVRDAQREVGPAARDVQSQGSPDVFDVQLRLARLGFYQGALDGQMGPQTRTALRLFEIQKGLNPTGRINPAVTAALEAKNDQSAGPRNWNMRDVQRGLARLGYYQGQIDGRIGPRTRDALRYFQIDEKLEPTGRIGPAVIDALRSKTMRGNEAAR